MLKITVPPTEIITVSDAADFMRAEFSVQEEALIESLITAARQWCEEYLRRAIGLQTLELRLEAFPSNNGPINLRCPVADVESIIYTDRDKQEITMPVDDFVVSDSEPARIWPTSSWPVTFNTSDAVVVTYQAGYQTGSPILTQELPKTIRTAMLMMVADMYSNREAQVEKQLMANPTVERLLSQYRLEMGQ